MYIKSLAKITLQSISLSDYKVSQKNLLQSGEQYIVLLPFGFCFFRVDNMGNKCCKDSFIQIYN